MSRKSVDRYDFVRLTRFCSSLYERNFKIITVPQFFNRAILKLHFIYAVGLTFVIFLEVAHEWTALRKLWNMGQFNQVGGSGKHLQASLSLGRWHFGTAPRAPRFKGAPRHGGDYRNGQ